MPHGGREGKGKDGDPDPPHRPSDLPWGEPPGGHRLPPSARPGPVRLQVADLERSRRWYEGVLGLRSRDLPGGGLALLPPGGPVLVEFHEHPGAAPASPGGRPGLYHFALLLPDRRELGRFVDHLRRLETGGAPGSAPGPVGLADHFVSEALYLHDPDGLGVEVYADRPREDWRTRGRELVMGTVPLDLGGLARAGGEARWEGIPPGTVMGHVHLQVGDLPTAEDFYHRGLGMDRMVWSYPGALFLSAGGYHHHLGLNTWARSTTPPAPDDARLLEWTLVLPSAQAVAAAVKALEEVGVEAEGMADAPGNGTGTREGNGVVVRDPWGTALRLTVSSV